jgi:hypothetical protein
MATSLVPSGILLGGDRLLQTGEQRVARMKQRKSDVSDLRKLTMAELGNTRVLRNAGIPDCASLHPGYACDPRSRRWVMIPRIVGPSPHPLAFVS